MTFTHYSVNDTTLNRIDGGYRFTFTRVNGKVETADYRGSIDTLFRKINDYFELGKHADVFDNLSIPAQDALYNVLWAMAQNNMEV